MNFSLWTTARLSLLMWSSCTVRNFMWPTWAARAAWWVFSTEWSTKRTSSYCLATRSSRRNTRMSSTWLHRSVMKTWVDAILGSSRDLEPVFSKLIFQSTAMLDTRLMKRQKQARWLLTCLLSLRTRSTQRLPSRIPLTTRPSSKLAMNSTCSLRNGSRRVWDELCQNTTAKGQMSSNSTFTGPLILRRSPLNIFDRLTI